MFYTTKITSFLALICPLFASVTIMYSVSIGKLTSGVEKKDQGSILGLDMALTQLQRIIAPLVATRLASDYSLQHVLVLSAIMCSISIFFCLIDTDKDDFKKND
jgi:predicted MFS family arabinose efflux permease